MTLPSDGEGERFGHILAGAHERTADGYAVRHHIEERNREFAWWQADQDASATLPGHANALLECDERRRRNQNAMSSAAGRLLDGGCRVSGLGIDHEIGAEALGMGQLAVINVDGANEQSHGLGILDGQVPESASAGDSDPFARPRLSLLDPLVGRDSSADQRRGFRRRKTGRNMGNVVRVGKDILGKTAVRGVAAELRLRAHRFPSRQAILAVTARRVEPGHSDAVALLNDRHARSNGGDQTDGLMAQE